MPRYIRFALPLMALIGFGPSLFSQGQGPAPVAPVPMINQSQDPALASFRFRSIGPASMGGRIDDLAISESDPSIMYVGYATGGVFKSVNAGTTFEPIFDVYGTASIGDLAIHPTNPNILYVGTGEANNRQTSSFGDGMYKTTDGGKTFTHIGLRETQTIARIVIDPRNPDTLYVAVLGHLFGPNKERGVYKSVDGGKTWNNVKFIDENTGFTDIVMDPANSSILYAASYQRRRSGCCFNGGGPGSGIWKTTDAGKTWTKMTGNGLPPGTYGRIALDVSRSNPNVVYAQIEAGEDNQPMPQARRRTRRWRRRWWWRRWSRIQLVQQRRPEQGLRRPRGSGGGSESATHASRARYRARRAFPVGQQGSGLAAHQQLQLAPDVLQSAARGSDERQGRLRRGTALREVAGWRQDVRHA